MNTRRKWLAAAGLLPLIVAGGVRAQGAGRAPTPSCGSAAEPTPRQTEGPYYTPDTPRRASLVESGSTLPRLILEGSVLSTQCRPVAAAMLDFWHCDERGEYDNAGYRYRGHVFADAAGRYRLETIFPGAYPGRTRHIHVRVQAPNGPILTTQLYFPGEASNARDWIHKRELEMRVQQRGGERLADFDFVIRA